MATAPQAQMDMPQEAAPNPFSDPNTMAVYDQMRQTVSPKEFSDEVLAGASQVDPEEVAKFKAELEQLEVPMEVLDMLNNMVDEILANPDNYEQVKQKYEAMGVTDDLLPAAFDGEFFSALNMAVDQMIAEPAGAQAFAKGGIAELTPISKAVADYGRNGDTMLAHITPAEARMLRRRGGAGTTNPNTGLKEYFSLKKLFKGIGNAVKSFASSTVGKIVTTVALGFFLGPAAASMVGATSAAGVAAVSGFVGGAGSTLLGGGNLKDALKAGAIGGLTAGVTTGVTQGFGTAYQGPTTVGGQIDKFTGMVKTPAFPEYTAQGALTDNATSNAAREAYAGELYKTNPEAFYNPAPTPTAPLPGQPGSDVLIGGKPAIPPAPLPGQPGSDVLVGGKPAIPPLDAVQAPYDPATATRAVDYGYKPGGASSAAYRTPTISESFSKLGEGLGMGDGPASYKTFVEGATDLFAPGPNNAQITARAQEIMSTTPGATLKDAMAAASKELSPGILRTYGPAAVAGIGALALGGGFKPTDAAASTLKPELMKPVTQRIAEGGNQRNFYMQGLPGVKYDQYGAPIFGQNVPLPTFDTGLGIASLMNPRGYAGGGSVTAANFDSDAYLKANPDVAASIAKGEIADAYSHYTQYGQAEGRTAFDKAETAATAAKDADAKAAAQAANRKLVADAKAAKKAAGYGSAYQNINAGLSYDAPAGYAAPAIAARQAAFKPTMDKFTNAQTVNAATLAKAYTPTVVAQPYNNTTGYANVLNTVAPPVNYDTTPVGLTAAELVAKTAAKDAEAKYAAAQAAHAAQRAATDKASADAAAAAKAAADKAAADAAAAAKLAADRAAADKAQQEADRLAAAKAAAAATATTTVTAPPVTIGTTGTTGTTTGTTGTTGTTTGTTGTTGTTTGTTGTTTVQPPVTTGYTGRAITDQEIKDYLISNPNATDRDLVKIMDQYNVRPEQVARATGMQGVDPSSFQNINFRYADAKSALQNNPNSLARQNQADAVTGKSIQEFFAKNPGMTDAQIANYMDTNMIDPRQMQAAFAGTPGAISSQDVLQRYNAAITGPTRSVFATDSLPTPPAAASGQTKLLNMGGIASLGSGGYPRRTGQISGPGTATSDSIPAMLSDGEFVMTAKAVRGAGKGDRRAGAKRMYALMNQLEKNAARG